MNVTCIGVGNIGRSWALVFIRAGHHVTLWDQDLGAIDRALIMIRNALQEVSSAGLSTDTERALNNIRTAKTIDDAVKNADYVQESVAEKVEIKIDIFRSLDNVVPAHCIIASSSSAIPASEFLQGLKGRHRCLIVHPVNPPHVIPLVELCAAPWTTVEVLQRTKDFMEQLGQSPIVVKKEIEGFVLNRLQWALLGEAMHLVGEGYCSIEEIDKVLTDGLALRWAFMGPFEVGHLNASQGIRGYFTVLEDAIERVQASLKTDYCATDAIINEADKILSNKHPIDKIPERQALRDIRILQLRHHLRSTKL